MLFKTCVRGYFHELLTLSLYEYRKSGSNENTFVKSRIEMKKITMKQFSKFWEVHISIKIVQLFKDDLNVQETKYIVYYIDVIVVFSYLRKHGLSTFKVW